MSVLSLISAHGSPGVTTTALALGATWPEHRSCLLVEADLSGGVIAARFGLGDAPGASSLAAAARRGLDHDSLWENAQRLPGGLAVLVGPASPEEAHAVWRDLASELTAWSGAHPETDVIVDGDRVAGRSPSQAPLLAAGTVRVVVRPSVDQLRPAAIRLEALESSGVDASLLLVGDQPYGAYEVATTLGVSVMGVVAWDPNTASVLTGTPGALRDLRRTPLVRSATTLATGMAPRPHDLDPLAGIEPAPGNPEPTDVGEVSP